MNAMARTRKRIGTRPLGLLALAITIAIGACATSAPKEPPEGKGFLGDYEGFEPVPDRPGALRWVAEGASLAGYDRVLLDPVTVWYTARADGVDISELQALADAFVLEINRALGRAYPLTLEPGPNVLRLRIAITEVSESSGMRKTMRVISGTGPRTSGYEAQHESALIDIDAMTIEVEALDSVSGERLVGLVENRIAPQRDSSTDTWRSINGALAEWARHLREALDEGRLRGSPGE